MVLGGEDPFAGVRNKEPPNEEVGEDEIKEYYAEYAAGKVDLTNPRSVTEMHGRWAYLLERFIMESPAFQRLVLNSHLTPDVYPDLLNTAQQMRLSPEWVLGIYLPGFWDVYKDKGINDFFTEWLHKPDPTKTDQETRLSKIFRRAAENANHIISFNILANRENTYGTQGELADNPIETSAPLKTVNSSLFSMALAEKRGNEARLDTRRVLKDLSAFLEGEEFGDYLLGRYGIKTTADTKNIESLVDRFGGPTLELLLNQSGLQDIKAYRALGLREDPRMNVTLDDRTKEFEEGVDEQAVTEHETATEEPHPATFVSGLDAISEEHEPLPEEQALREQISLSFSNTFKLSYYPHWNHPTGSPISIDPQAFDNSQESESLPEITNATKAPRDAGRAKAVSAVPRVKSSRSLIRQASDFKAGRMLTDEEWNRKKLASGLGSKHEVLDNAIKLFKSDMTKAQSSPEDISNFEACINELRGIGGRPPAAVEAEASCSKLLAFTHLQYLDNWYHVRKYFQALEYYNLSRGTNYRLRKDFEPKLMIIIAGIRGGVRYPLAVVMIMEHVLRELWSAMLASIPGPPTPRMRLIFDELCLFVYGSAISGLALRYRSNNYGSLEFASQWYPLILEFDPRCANPDCTRLLPAVEEPQYSDADLDQPDDDHETRVRKRKSRSRYPLPNMLEKGNVRALFSGGTRRARIGNRAFRKLLGISENRDCAYNCPYELLRVCFPSRMTVVVMFWFSHIYHSVACKNHRGKLAITSF